MPQWLGAFHQRISIADLARTGEGLVAGLAKKAADHCAYLSDQTGHLPLQPVVSEAIESFPAWAAVYQTPNGRQVLRYQRQRHHAEAPFIAQEPDGLIQRWKIHQAIREFFLVRGFLQVDTPLAVPCPGMEPYLDSFPAGSNYLRTSPELHMKRILAAGIEPIFQMGPCFRAGDIGSQHREEFLMLEWYRLFADLDHIAQDVAALLSFLAPFSSDPAYFSQALFHITCAELFQQFVQIELTDHVTRKPLRNACERWGVHYLEDDDWDTLFFRLFLDRIEPHLGMNAPTLVTQFPASQAALAKKAPPRTGLLPTCYRFELFIKRIEIANAFYELTDAQEQRQRFTEQQEERRKLNKPVYPMDEPFLNGLSSGLPPAAGIALGVDRLVLALLGRSSFDQLLPFP